MSRIAATAMLLVATVATVGIANAQPAPPESVLDHFLCYSITETKFGPKDVVLHDQFSENPLPRTLTSRWLLCNPVQKQETGKGEPTPIKFEDTHLLCYMIDDKVHLRIKNQLDKTNEQQFKLVEEKLLCVPTAKQLIRDPNRPPETPMPPPPKNADHFKCYTLTKTPTLRGTYDLKDQIGSYRITELMARYLCNPVDKKVGEEETRRRNPAAHLVCYIFKSRNERKHATVRFKNQLDSAELIHVDGPVFLCVPSTKEWR